MSGQAEWVAYTYAVARPFDPDKIAGLRGLDGAAVRLIGDGHVVAVVSAHAPGTLDEDVLRARLETLDDLEAVARAHHGVVDAVAAHSVTIPFRLATIHNGDHRVLEVLHRGHRKFNAALDRLAGRVELGVKVYAEPASAVPAVPAAENGSAATPASHRPGRDYLRRRKAQADQRDDARRRATEALGRVDHALAGLAADHRHHAPQSSQLSGVGGDNVLNAAYLVDAEAVATFMERVDTLDSELPQTRIVVTGPWAPYSFAVLDDDEGRTS
jgi:Gas vesicle synthesis protein GvpL/GvpF